MESEEVERVKFEMLAVYSKEPYKVTKENKKEFDRLAEEGNKKFIEWMKSVGLDFAFSEENDIIDDTDNRE